MKNLFKIFFSAILALVFASSAFCVDIQKVDRFLNGKLLPQHHSINATYPNNWNATTGVLSDVSVGGKLRSIKQFTASGLYTKPSWLKFLRVKLVGGGASSGGRKATTSSQFSLGEPGGGGGYAEKWLNATDVNATEWVVVGLGGAAPSAGNNGENGGTTSFGTHCSATGGLFGQALAASGTAIYGSARTGGVGVGGDINLNGQDGARVMIAYNTMYSYTIPGGSSMLGFGGTYGYPGNNYGGGAGGHMSGISLAAQPGLAGGNGTCIVEEYE